ncbi:hypothetical protein EVAR_24628_1 [Eumeta japonica]|uniref:Uncharacterized protein n=1 Tax=Eumeta variegata TaxID=151549 RepID=A0A4C1V2Z4_EUMVA|nr:hypothetical protein EVAR_24628_1 [Eumeta japonica]
MGRKFTMSSAPVKMYVTASVGPAEISRRGARDRKRAAAGGCDVTAPPCALRPARRPPPCALPPCYSATA